jgi:oligopeptide transport system ATP-binding protein
MLLEAEHLTKWFPVKKWFFEKQQYVKAVDDVTFSIRKGETFGIAGESGCGKSTLLRTALRLIEPTGGVIHYDGDDITHMGKRQLRKIRQNMQIVFQDPYSALDGRMKVGRIIEEPLVINRLCKTQEERTRRAAELMEQVGLDPSYMDRYPHEFSGGQRQRIGIARALATNPRFIVCDEAVSALDVSIKAQVINMFEDLQKKLGVAYLFIAHDLLVVHHISKRIAVMYLGKMVETADADELNSNPMHPYTTSLLSAVPYPDPKIAKSSKRIILEGDVPSPLHMPSGCPFRTRCKYATEQCAQEMPKLTDRGNGHMVACWNK